MMIKNKHAHVQYGAEMDFHFNNKFRKWNMLHKFSERPCEIHNSHRKQVLLISDNKCFFIACQQNDEKGVLK